MFFVTVFDMRQPRCGCMLTTLQQEGPSGSTSMETMQSFALMRSLHASQIITTKPKVLISYMTIHKCSVMHD